MGSTVGELVDRLIVSSLKMWWQQEHIYEIRKMTLEEFKERYWSKPEGAEKIFNYLQKACDLNLQRNQLMNEIDQRLVEMIEAKAAGEDLDNGKFIQRAHKTY